MTSEKKWIIWGSVISAVILGLIIVSFYTHIGTLRLGNAPDDGTEQQGGIILKTK